MNVVLRCCLYIDPAWVARLVELFDGFQCEIRMNCFGAVGSQNSHMVRLKRTSGFDDKTGIRSETCRDQVLVNRTDSKRHRDCDTLFAHLPIRQDQNVVAVFNGIHSPCTKRSQTSFYTFFAPGNTISRVNFIGAELISGVAVDAAHLRHFFHTENRLGEFQTQRRVDVVDVEKIRTRTHEGNQRHHKLFADRINRRIGHLSKQLTEVLIERLGSVREHRKRCVVSHGADCFGAFFRHRAQNKLNVVFAVAERFLTFDQRNRIIVGQRRRSNHVREMNVQALCPFLIRIAQSQGTFDFFVFNDAALFGIDHEHLARLQTPFLFNLTLRNRQCSCFRSQDHNIVVGQNIAARTKTVSVEYGTDAHTVGKSDSRRTVPRFQHGCVVFVESALSRIHLSFCLLPSFRNGQHHGLSQRVAAHDQKFKHVV